MKFRRDPVNLSLLALLGCSPLVLPDASAADLRLQFVYQGPAPVLRPREQLLLDPNNQGVKDIVVYVYTGPRGTDLPLVDPRNRRVNITTFNGQVEPRMTIAQTGDTLVIQPKDQATHAFNVMFLNNACDGMATRPNEEVQIHLAKPEPAAIPIECKIHPAMRAFLMVLDHPYAAKSNRRGELEINDLPDNTELTFRTFHELGPLRRATINENEVDWGRRSLFKVTTSMGVTDLGTITLTRKSFRGLDQR